MSARVAPEVGESFGGYAIESVLDRGGMGTVYLATQEPLGRKVALKAIAPELSHDEEFRIRFLRESRLAASLDHPNVIPIYDAGEIGGVLYLAMRYAPGPTLHARLRERGRLIPEEVLAVAEQIGGALDAAHAAGLVHRDVKPANILVTEPGQHLYLCDFGLAKQTSSPGTTRTGTFFGSVDYTAPEQIQDSEIDGRADVYSLGCILYECLTGRPPFVRESDFAVLRAHLEDPPPSASGDGLPEAVDDVFARALAKNPAGRYPTAGDLAGALRDTLAASGGVRDAAVTRAAPAFVSGPGTAVPTVPIAQSPPDGKSHRLRRAGHWWIALAVVLLAAAAVVVTALVTRSSSSTNGAADVPAFVDRIENVLEQSSGGRSEIGIALAAGLKCTIAPRVAAERIASVADNRQSILDQLGSTEAPTPQSARVVTLLERALQQSIEADRHYRDAFVNSHATTCPLPSNGDFVLARAADAKATAAKERFVAAFDPLARAHGRRPWLGSEI